MTVIEVPAMPRYLLIYYKIYFALALEETVIQNNEIPLDPDIRPHSLILQIVQKYILQIDQIEGNRVGVQCIVYLDKQIQKMIDEQGQRKNIKNKNFKSKNEIKL